MDAEIKESDLLGETETSTNPLHALQQAIAAMPDIDPEKVAAAMAKLRSGCLEISGTDSERLACAERIAKQIMDESSNCDSD